jgi:hypothetical protein
MGDSGMGAGVEAEWCAAPHVQIRIGTAPITVSTTTSNRTIIRFPWIASVIMAVLVGAVNLGERRGW